MEAATRARVLVLAHRTAATPRILAKVRERAKRGPCHFTLLVPALEEDRDGELSRQTLELAIPLLAEAAGGEVAGIVGDADPLVAVRSALGRESFDEVIVSTLPARVSRWLKRDLPARIERLGVPVTVVTHAETRSPILPAAPFRGD